MVPLMRALTPSGGIGEGRIESSGRGIQVTTERFKFTPGTIPLKAGVAVVLALALLFFGPSKLPALGASLGEAIRGFKRGLRSEEPEPERPALESPEWQ